MNRTFTAVLVSCSLAVLPLTGVAAESLKPDATMDIAGTSVGVGVGLSEAKGTLHYQGKNYRVRMEGVSIGEAGASNVTATGEVFNLKQLQDFDGNYTAGSAGLVVAGGGTETTMTNQKGVVIRLHGTNEGVDVRLSVDGVSFKVAQ